MVTKTASASDVKDVIDTDLADAEVNNYIDDFAFEASQAVGDYANTLTTEEKRQLEKYGAALRIRELRDRSMSNVSRETASVSYEGMSLNALRREVEKRDPSNSLAYMTDDSRYVNSTG